MSFSCAIRSRQASQSGAHALAGAEPSGSPRRFLSVSRRPLPEQSLLRVMFDYDPDGFLVWSASCADLPRVKAQRDYRAWCARYIGKRAGVPCYSGKRFLRRRISIGSISYIATRLIWKWRYGDEPEVIDHIDHNTLNDAIENLRAADLSQSAAYRRGYGESGVKGVRASGKKWIATLCGVHLGTFSNIADAAAAYAHAAALKYGEFSISDHRNDRA